ncbi:Adenosylmethionine-8-amino-7-oxononanoate aminotransferase [Caenispirillum salinarum AK4]|uniref:Adenosylmethionine-8-amino-7-oxononanoate aminotransferase n=1 Tax=Caenispirillum salinarum AK4 TaxID=1238182 RepID=K9GQA1_9PROT|nr:aspartate aminotransferase family protein [Caenispirillum salinarum]EKV27342.1 Adenosylmethionine-8-amino-7-oxononanoate aminotransferase [Caenispirillum salinarum AK4]
MTSNSLRDADIAYTLHPYTNAVAHEQSGPMVAMRGKGVRVYDDAGKDYIEGMAGLWCTSLGWGEDRLVDAATRQMKELAYYHSFNHKATEPGIRLAETLVQMAPVPMSKAFFCNSGSEANDTAIKMIWYYHNAIGKPEKKKIIARLRGYHGVTVAAASLTGLPLNQKGFDLPIERILHTSCPHHYRYGEAGETEEDFASRMAADLEALIEREGPDTIAAFFAEPVMGAGGVIVPPKTYFEKIQPILKKHDILFVADEVICGFGRTGKMFGTETFGLQPDIMTMAKALSSAYLPISAVLINETVYQGIRSGSDALGAFGHGYTYSAHPVAAAVANETLAIYEERDMLGHVNSVSPRMQERLRALADHPLVGEARGIGLIGAVELVADKATKENFDPARKVGPSVAAKAQNNGVILRAMAGDIIAFSPPLVISTAEIDEMFDRFGAALDTQAEAMGL